MKDAGGRREPKEGDILVFLEDTWGWMNHEKYTLRLEVEKIECERVKCQKKKV